MISKTYNVYIKTVKKFPDAQKEYFDIDKVSTTPEPISTIKNSNWAINLSDGKLSNADIIDNGRKISLSSNGPIDILDSYLKVDGKEYYALTHINNGATNAFIYERHNGKSYIKYEYDIINNKISYIEQELLSIANINGVKDQSCTHSQIQSFLGTLTSDMNIYEEAIPFYFNSTKFVLSTQYFPIYVSYKIYGYDTVLGAYIDLNPYIYKTIIQTGEVVIDKANIDKVKIFYFVSPAISNNTNDLYLLDSSGQFVNIDSNPNKSYMEYDITSNDLTLDTSNVNKITLECKMGHNSIEANRRLIINGVRTNKLYERDIYTIAPSFDIHDNIKSTSINLEIPTIVDNKNVAIFGMFNTPYGKRLSLMALGLDTIDPLYAALSTTSGIDSYTTILHTTNAAHPTEQNGIIQYDFIHNFDTGGYQFTLPAWADLNTINVLEVNGLISSSFSSYEIIEPDVIIFNKKFVDLSKTYRIQFQCLVSPLLSYVDTYQHKAYIKSSENVFTHYDTLEALYVLSKDTISIMFKDESEIYSERYFDNSIDITINVTQNYIKASLEHYKALILGN